MSAWIVSEQHINAMVALALLGPKDMDPKATWSTPYMSLPPAGGADGDWSEPHRLTIADASVLGQMLWRECLNSVAHRYPNDTGDGDRPGPIGFKDANTDKYTFLLPMRMPTLPEAVNVIGCYEYQSCEHPEWKESAAREFCVTMIDRLANLIPGVKDAPWGWDFD